MLKYGSGMPFNRAEKLQEGLGIPLPASTQWDEELHAWLTRQFDQRLVEPNSALGGAIAYLLKYWEKLTLFLCVPTGSARRWRNVPKTS